MFDQTQEEKEQDFLKAEDTTDLDLFKIKEKLLEVEKLVLQIAEKVGAKL